LNTIVASTQNHQQLGMTHNCVPAIVFRYVKPSHHKDATVLDEAFQLRENRSPPEEYISFYFSDKATLIEKLQCVENNMCTNGGFSFQKNGGLLMLNTIQANENINTTRELIRFEDKQRNNKIGMHYLSNNSIDIIEVKTILAFLSEFHPKETF
jgi:hypothetical protein